MLSWFRNLINVGYFQNYFDETVKLIFDQIVGEINYPVQNRLWSNFQKKFNLTLKNKITKCSIALFIDMCKDLKLGALEQNNFYVIHAIFCSSGYP